MRVGLIARAEDRGLGILTWEWWRHMAPDRTLVVDLGSLARGFPMHLDRYGVAADGSAPDGTIVVGSDATRFQERDVAAVRAWISECDVIYTAEVPYDGRLPGWCQDAGVALVCHVMPEFFRWTGQHPLVRWWLPTTWMRDRMPRAARVVPVPVPLDRWPEPAPYRPGPPTFLHVAGHRAAGDRNGTNLLLAALGRCSAEMCVRVVTQDGRLPRARTGRGVALWTDTAGPADYWQLYDPADVLVLPRRYGGLSLPVHEAAGAGLGLVLPQTPPNGDTWPAHLVHVANRRPFPTPAGLVVSAGVDVGALAAAMDHLARHDLDRHRLQTEARRWAVEHSWAELAPTITAELADACG